jgi:hypothetical protein
MEANCQLNWGGQVGFWHIASGSLPPTRRPGLKVERTFRGHRSTGATAAFLTPFIQASRLFSNPQPSVPSLPIGGSEHGP